MTDLHTHILPGMDDGAQSVEEAVEMLRLQVQQGVDTVALTPHFYPERENIADFLARRESARLKLLKALQGQQCPKLILGAEVAWVPDMTEWPELESLCYQNTKTILIELPIYTWTDSLFRQLYSMESRRGVMPVIAHIDRYFRIQSKRNLERLLEMGYPIQVSAEALLRLLGRKQALELLKYYDGLLISDCHNLLERGPNLEQAMAVVKKKLGARVAQEISNITDEILKD